MSWQPARRLARRLLPPVALWYQIAPGVDHLLELRWARRIRRAPVLDPERHASAVRDASRNHADKEVPGACPLCDGSAIQGLLHPRDRRHRPPRWDYHVVRCAACGFLYRHPGIRAERVGDLYASGRYARFLGGSYTERRVRRYEIAMAPFGALFERGGGRRLLDYGCGNGLFLDLAHARGFDTYGVDLAADAVKAARSRPGGRNAYHGTPAEAPEIAAGGFDVITLWSVLAHLAEPVDDLTMLRGLLAPDGVLLLLTVNAGSLKLKRDLAAWGGFTPNHLVFFSAQTLPLLLRRAGFAAVAMPPWYGEPVERGAARLRPWQERRVRAVIDRGNRGNMLRAVAFNDPEGPARWGVDGFAIT